MAFLLHATKVCAAFLSSSLPTKVLCLLLSSPSSLTILMWYINTCHILQIFPKRVFSILTISKAVNVARCTPKDWNHRVPFVLHWQLFQSNQRLSISQRYKCFTRKYHLQVILQCIALSLHVRYIFSILI